MVVICALAAHLCLAIASQHASRPTMFGFGLCLAALGLSWLGAISSRDWAPANRVAARVAILVLVSEWLLSLNAAVMAAVGRERVSITTVVVATLVMGFVSASFWHARARPIGIRLALFAVTMACVGAWVIVGWPRPSIDVLGLQESAVAELLDARNPYREAHVGVRWDSRFDGAPVRAGEWVRSYPYPPLSIAAAMPGVLIGGDARWSQCVAMILAGVLIGLGVGSGAVDRGGPTRIVAPATYFNTPMNLYVLFMSWTEPMLALAASFSIWALVRRRSIALTLALAVCLALKQYGVLWVAAMATTRHINARVLLGSVALAALTYVPFAIWDWESLWRGIVTYHTSCQIRPDSFSLPAQVFLATGIEPPRAFVLVVAGALVASLALRPRTIAQAALGGSAAILVSVLFGHAGHLNYLWLAQYGLLLAIAVGAPPRFEPSVGI